MSDADVVTCPDCGADWDVARTMKCPGCFLDIDDLEAALAFMADIAVERSR